MSGQTLQDARAVRQGHVCWRTERHRVPSAAGAPSGWRLVRDGADGNAYRQAAGGHSTVIETIGCEADSRIWHHVSLARRDRLPTWDELRAVKAAFVGEDTYAYVVLPPLARYVNLNPNCLHLWSCLDRADGAVLPPFEGPGKRARQAATEART